MAVNARWIPAGLRHLVEVDKDGNVLSYLGNVYDARQAIRTKHRLSVEHGLPLDSIAIRMTVPKGN